MKKCEEIKELINMYIDNELSEEEKVQVERHIGDCEQCRVEYEKLLKVHELSLLVKPEEPPIEYFDALTLKIRRRIRNEGKPRRRRFLPSFQLWPQVASAAVIIFVACISLLIIFKSEEGVFVAKQEIPLEDNKSKTIMSAERKIDEAKIAAPEVKKSVGKAARTQPAPAVPKPTTTTSARVGAVATEIPEKLPDTRARSPVALKEKEEPPAAADHDKLELQAGVKGAESAYGFYDGIIVEYEIAPVVAETVPLSIPKDRDLSRVRGDVSVSVSVDSLGTVNEANIIRSSGDVEIDSAVLNSVRQYRFQPAQYQNRRVQAQTILRVQVR